MKGVLYVAIRQENVKMDVIKQDISAITERIDDHTFQLLTFLNQGWLERKKVDYLEEHVGTIDNPQRYLSLVSERFIVLDDVENEIANEVYTQLRNSYGDKELFDHLQFEVFAYYYTQHSEKHYYILQSLTNLIQSEQGIHLELSLPEDGQNAILNRRMILTQLDEQQRVLSNLSNEGLVRLFEEHYPERLDEETQQLIDQFILDVEEYTKKDFNRDEKRMAEKILREDLHKNLSISAKGIDWADISDIVFAKAINGEYTRDQVENELIRVVLLNDNLTFSADWTIDESEFAYDLEEMMV